MGISRACAYRWWAHFRAEGKAGLVDRPSHAHNHPRRPPACTETRIRICRHLTRSGPIGIGAHLQLPASTVGRVLRRHRTPHLAACDPVTGQPTRATANRYEHDHPGSLIHIDVTKIGRIPDGGGWRLHGRGARPTAVRGLGYDYVHAAIDDHSRLAYAEILTDEKGTTCAAFLTRAAAFYAGHGITIERVISDNAMNYRRSAAFTATITTIGARHRFIRPHCPGRSNASTAPWAPSGPTPDPSPATPTASPCCPPGSTTTT